MFSTARVHPPSRLVSKRDQPSQHGREHEELRHHLRHGEPSETHLRQCGERQRGREPRCPPAAKMPAMRNRQQMLSVAKTGAT